MDELYPGMKGDGCIVAGVAQVSGGDNVDHRTTIAKQLVAGFYSFGRRNFFVYQFDSSKRFPEPDPSFSFWPLTAEFVTNAIENDPTFEFSIVSERIGDVTYVSGAQARDTGEIRQGMTSLHAAGAWSIEGLRFRLTGGLGDRAAFLGQSTPSEYKNASYSIDIEIPWTILRFMFFDRRGFVITNYKKFCLGDLDPHGFTTRLT